jgi:hypothetical protein
MVFCALMDSFVIVRITIVIFGVVARTYET